MHDKEPQSKSEVALREEATLTFWKDQDIFNKTLDKAAPNGEFVFFEGPPTANGKPGIHHLEARAFKDAIPRYKTMQGFHVRRKGGWDTHGLPVELQVEKALGLNSKKAIEEYGIEKFNEKCKESVWEYLSIWETFTDRIGYWVYQKNPYVTYHNSYIESVWNVLKKVNDKGLVYKDYRIVPWCPRCGTALSSHELAQGYQDDKDLSVTAKFKVVGQENTFILAWTTTPWTLPGNVALAVGNDIDYVKVKKDTEIYILAKARIETVLKEISHEVLETVKGSELVGLEYEPLYPYLKDKLIDSGDHAAALAKSFKVYPADFVTTEDGTGVVHTAVMYGQDDFELGTKLGLPKFHMVNAEGHFLPDTGFLDGRFVKDEEVAVDIIKDLAHRGLLFKKEKYEHSYPHCWRCKTPLIYYARDSWYIRMSDPTIKAKLIEENKSIKWEPEYIRDGRFGEWLKDLKDWAISRERYWGTPLPIWMNHAGEREFIGSLSDLRAKTKKSGNTYYAMRHGYGQHMDADVVSSLDHDAYHLTDEGQEQVAISALALKQKAKVTRIFASPLLRTQETARIAAIALGIDPNEIITDIRLREYDYGEWDGKSWRDYVAYREANWKNYDDKLGGSSLLETKKRFGDFFYDIESKYKDETILIVTHGIFFETVPAMIEGADKARSREILFETFKNNRIQPAEVRQFDFVPLPHNEDYELDLHRPYIDSIQLVNEKGETLTRVKEVMDVWFDSGAMPYAQDHYPFENKEWVDGPGYPADFICEAIDQTRGWFYTLHAIATLMDRGHAFKNVICLGHILDAQGKKMSKSLGNIVDPWKMMDTYGVDTLRLWMYSVNQPGESKNFDEKTVAELRNKVFTTLGNVVTFYELYRDVSLEKEADLHTSENVLDQWIIARLNQFVQLSTENLNNFKLLEPVRALREFIDDLSTWYVRRSRERLKDNDVEAKRTLYIVLKTLSKVMAPFAPFTAEDMWQKLKTDTDVESVHLAQWPKAETADASILESMQEVRRLVTLGLEARQKAKIIVRQPLGIFNVKNLTLKAAYIEILQDELNVKNVSEKASLENEIELDTTITPELKREGDYRELVRSIQDLRKQTGLTPSDVIILTLPGKDKETIVGFEENLKKTVLAKEVEFGDELAVKKI
jgi:isoleucyl-tRNA synthetase